MCPTPRVSGVALLVLQVVCAQGGATRSEQHEALMKEGVALHEGRQYSDAIRKYTQVVAEDPTDVEAWYEMSYSQMLAGDAIGCANSASQGLKYKSNLEPALYAMLGSCLDNAGQRNKAIETLKNGIKRAPGFGMLYFNLGVTQGNAGQLDDARKSLRDAVQLMPRHAGSHLALASVYRRSAYKIPSLLAALVFLLIEPNSPRSPQAVDIVAAAIGGMVTSGKKPGDVNINVTLDSKKDEGDFGPAELVLAMGMAPVKEEKLSDFERVSNGVDLLGSTIDTKCKPAEFACGFYGEFFRAVSKKQFTRAMLSRALASSSIKGRVEWATANQPQVDEFAKWLAAYDWNPK